MNTSNIRRGDMVYANLDPVRGSEQCGSRPVIIVQNDIGNAHSPTTIAIPCTHSQKKDLPTHLILPQSIGLAQNSIALAEQIRTIDCSRISDYIGHISYNTDIWQGIEKIIAVSLGIENRQPQKVEIHLLNLCSKCEAIFKNNGYFIIQKCI